MKYYVYISKTKIEMLYSQIISKEKDVSFKGRMNIGILSLEAESNDKVSIYDKLGIVINGIADVGDVYSDADYIQGTLVMGWNARNKLNYDSNATYWIGESWDNDGILNKVLLIGSQHHIIGNEKSDDYCYSTSYIDSFFNNIEYRLNFNTLEYENEFGQSEISSEKDREEIEAMKAKNIPISGMQRVINSQYLANFIDEFSKWHNGIFQEYEFVAKLLHSEIKIDDNGDMIRYVIATPIYVALHSQVNKRIIMDGDLKKYILTKTEFEQYKMHDFKTIHLLLKRSDLDEENFTKEMKLQYKKCKEETTNFDRESFIQKAIEIVKRYFYVIEQ